MFQDIIVPSKQGDPPAQNDAPSRPSSGISEVQPKKPRKKREGLRGLLSVVSIFAIATLLAVSITTFVFQSYQVDGPSMETTLQDNDRLIVMKTAKTWSNVRGKQYVPDRYDVIVFDSVTTFDNGNKRQLIKRVIGLPGEHVVVNDGLVTIYNEEFPDGMNPDENQTYATSFDTTSGNVDLELDDNEIFVLGDNRSNSLDSRNFGTVPIENVVGYLSVRIFPLNKITNF